jgi:heterodisulfide reductase subunit A
MTTSNSSEDLRIGVYVCHCGSNIAGVINPESVVEYVSKLPGVVHASDTLYACADSGQRLIKEDIKKHNLNRVVVAACSVRMHEPTFRAAVAEPLNPFTDGNGKHTRTVYLGAWSRPQRRTGRKPKISPQRQLPKHAFLILLEMNKVPVTKKAMVIGAGVSGISAALDLADQELKPF